MEQARFLLNCSDLTSERWTGIQRYNYRVMCGLSAKLNDRLQVVFGANGSIKHSSHGSSVARVLEQQQSSVTDLSSRALFHLLLPVCVTTSRAGLCYKMSGGLSNNLPLPCPIVSLIFDCFRFRDPQAFGVVDFHGDLRRANAILKRCAFVVCISEQTQNDVCDIFRFPRERTGVAYCGVDMPVNLEKSEFQPNVLMVNPGRGNKNWQDLFNAWHVLRSSGKLGEYRLRVAGALNEEQSAIHKWLESHNDTARSIDCLGYVSESELDALYRNADCVVVPSKFEGFGMPVIEAMAYGKAVITSDIPIFREVGGDAAEYFNLGNVELLSHKIFEICEDAAHFSSLRERARLQASRFSWETTVQKTLEYLNLVVN